MSKQKKHKKNRKEARLNKNRFNWGVNDASYLIGFAGTLAQLNLSEESLSCIIIDKMQLEYQKEITQIQTQSNEYVAGICSKIPVRVLFGDEDEE